MQSHACQGLQRVSQCCSFRNCPSSLLPMGRSYARPSAGSVRQSPLRISVFLQGMDWRHSVARSIPVPTCFSQWAESMLALEENRWCVCVCLLWNSIEYCSRLASLIIGDECTGMSLMHMQIVLPFLALVVQNILPSSFFSTYEFGNSCTVVTEPVAAPQCHGAASVSVAIYASTL